MTSSRLGLLLLALPTLAGAQSAQFNLSQFAHYLTTGGQGFTGSATVGTVAPSKFIVSPDTFVSTGSNPLVSAFEIDHNFGGAFQGLAAGQQITLVMTSATSNPTPITSQYAGLGVTAQANTSDGGTGGTPKGSLTGINPFVDILGAVQNWNSITGGEVDVAALSGSTIAKKIGWEVVQVSTDAVSGSLENLGYALANQSGATGWQVGLSFGNYDGFWPMTSSGTLIGCYAHGNTGSCGTTTNGIDFSNITFTGNPIKLTGFTLDNSGNETANSVTLAPSTSVPAITVTGNSGSASAIVVTPASGTNALQVTAGSGIAAGILLQGNANTTGNGLVIAQGAGGGTVINAASGTMNIQTGNATRISIANAGGITIGSSTTLTAINPNYSVGTTLTVATATGCSVTNGTPSSIAGGSQVAKFVGNSNGTGCTFVITVNGATGSTAPNVWGCWGSDTTSAVALAQSGVSTTTCTLKGTINANSDVIVVGISGG